VPLPQHSHSPMNGNFPAPVRTGSVSLPSAPGLPQRPAFAAPPVNAFQFQQMHQGQIPPPQSHNPVPYDPKQPAAGVALQSPPQGSAPPSETQGASSIDDLIANATKQADADNAAAAASVKTEIAPTAAPVKEEPVEEKSGKKDKEKEKAKATRLVYSDNETSPEEKMAMLPKYAFTPAQKSIVV